MNGPRDVVVVGGSAGAVEAMLLVASALPAGLPARVFLVIHVPPDAPSLLPRLLARHGPLAARHPRQGEITEAATIYVAPPGRHLLVHDGWVELGDGPPASGHRPSADVLFRSAALSCGPRVLGVVLSGNLHDGAAGLRAVVDAGGYGLVQAPAEAAHPGMPASALASVPEAETAPLARMAGRITALVGGTSVSAPRGARRLE